MDKASAIVGIDEVGRGCLAGPLVAAAVILSKPIDGLRDSKLLSKKRREVLAYLIKDQALAYGIGWSDNLYIDKDGLTLATSNAMRQALAHIKAPYGKIIIDGNYNYLSGIVGVECLVDADNLIASVSAASIIAKVARDQWMETIASKYPLYGFDKHVGYGTKLHLDSIKMHGPSPIHRITFKPLSTM